MSNWHKDQMKKITDIWIDTSNMWKSAEEIVTLANNQGLFRTKEEIKTFGKLLNWIKRQNEQ